MFKYILGGLPCFLLVLTLLQKKHDVIIISEHGEVLTDAFTIENSIGGFKKLHMEISSHMEPGDCIHIGLEETGIYSGNIRDFLCSLDFNVYMINPILTHHSRMAYSLRNTKTDKLDCLAICRYIMHNYTHLKPYISTLYTTSELKSLSRLRLDKLKLMSKSKMEFTRLLQIIFLSLPNTSNNILYGLSTYFHIIQHRRRLLGCTLNLL